MSPPSSPHKTPKTRVQDWRLTLDNILDLRPQTHVSMNHTRLTAVRGTHARTTPSPRLGEEITTPRTRTHTQTHTHTPQDATITPINAALDNLTVTDLIDLTALPFTRHASPFAIHHASSHASPRHASTTTPSQITPSTSSRARGGRRRSREAEAVVVQRPPPAPEAVVAIDVRILY